MIFWFVHLNCGKLSIQKTALRTPFLMLCTHSKYIMYFLQEGFCSYLSQPMFLVLFWKIFSNDVTYVLWRCHIHTAWGCSENLHVVNFSVVSMMMLWLCLDVPHSLMWSYMGAFGGAWAKVCAAGVEDKKFRLIHNVMLELRV